MNSAVRQNKFGCSGGLIPLFRFGPHFFGLPATHWNCARISVMKRRRGGEILQNSLLIPLLFGNTNKFSDIGWLLTQPAFALHPPTGPVI
jgi:hypothetical protein